jgi:hypothetical protein
MKTSGSNSAWQNFALAAAVLAFLLALLFHSAFESGIAIFANDGPIGATASLADAGWKNLNGIWSPLYWLGGRQPSLFLTPSNILLTTLNPVGFAKFYAPASLLILGLCSWVYFRSIKAPGWVCVVGSVAVALNVNSFSTACWGLGAWDISMGFAFLALATLQTSRPIHQGVRLSLAGLLVGVAVMQGFDTGAILSLYVAAFVVWQSLIEPGPRPVNFVKGAARGAVVALFAALMAAHALGDLVQTQIQGIAGTAQDKETREAQWDKATTWSLPKIETLRVIIPGLFGYRMEDDERHVYPGSYWGTSGQQPGWETHHQGQLRHSGNGEHAGVFVVLVAFWAVASALRRKDTPFGIKERRMIGFWAVAAVISLLFAFGRHAPFYQIVFHLPYFSTIRNPTKFMRPFHLAVGILFVYGLIGIARRHLQNPAPTGSIADHIRSWWRKASGFDSRWTWISSLVVALCVVGWFVYGSSQRELVRYLIDHQFNENDAQSIATFSVAEVGWFILFLILSAGILVIILSGALSGRRAGLAIAFVSLLIAADLGRADSPWIVAYDYREKYATNPIVDFLDQHQHEQRVAVLPAMMIQLEPSLARDIQMIQTLAYFNHETWLQHHFPYLGIQALDIPQEPRLPDDKLAFLTAIYGNPNLANSFVNPYRYWQLTNTRYLLGTVGVIDWLNHQPWTGGKPVFKIYQPFNITPKPGVTNYTRLEQLTADPTTNGPFALIEVAGVLPRAKLYANWQTIADNQATLKQLVSPEFDPNQQVIVADNLPAPTSPETLDPGTVVIKSYNSRNVRLEAIPTVPSVMLLNDHFDPAWKVTVDGRPEKILRANSVVRGVLLAPGKHEIEFVFQPKTPGFYFTVAGWIIALGLIAIVSVTAPNRKDSPPGD